MARCAQCSNMIFVGGVRDGNLRFCDKTCRDQAITQALVREVPEDIIDQQAWNVFQGPCSKYSGLGPIDVHYSHYVWSFLVMTSWSSKPHMVCRRCAHRAQLGAATLSFFIGWWGFPWGLVVTPVQIGRNLFALFRRTETSEPSSELKRLVRLQLAADVRNMPFTDETPPAENEPR